MRKHLLGLAIFISIVTAAVFVYGYFDTQPVPVIPAVDYPKEHQAKNLDKGLRLMEVEYRVSAAELDVKDRIFRAQVDLKWNGKHTPPDSMFMNFYLMNANGERTASMSKTVHLKDAFADRNYAGITVSLDKVDISFTPQENIYTFVKFSADGKFPSLPDERTALAKLTSILLLHDGQTDRNERVRWGR